MEEGASEPLVLIGAVLSVDKASQFYRPLLTTTSLVQDNPDGWIAGLPASDTCDIARTNDVQNQALRDAKNQAGQVADQGMKGTDGSEGERERERFC